MGLDMYLYAELYVGGEYRRDNDSITIKDSEHALYRGELTVPVKEIVSVTLKAGYWRKANAIHRWFVDNVADGNDDCRPNYLGLDTLEELKSLCLEVLSDHAKADELLPSGSGFFFGSTAYDEAYYKDLMDTVKIIDHAISMNTKYAGLGFYYRASW